jgi:hypothetical protein
MVQFMDELSDFIKMVIAFRFVSLN